MEFLLLLYGFASAGDVEAQHVTWQIFKSAEFVNVLNDCFNGCVFLSGGTEL